MTKELDIGGHGGDCACNACSYQADELNEIPSNAVLTADLKTMPLQEEATIDQTPTR